MRLREPFQAEPTPPPPSQRPPQATKRLGLGTVRLYTDGVPFWKWRTPSALRGVLMAHAFEILFWDYSTLLAGDDRYREYAQKYMEMYEKDYTQLRSQIDQDEDNILKDEMATGSSVIMLSSSARRFKSAGRNR